MIGALSIPTESSMPAVTPISTPNVTPPTEVLPPTNPNYVNPGVTQQPLQTNPVNQVPQNTPATTTPVVNTPAVSWFDQQSFIPSLNNGEVSAIAGGIFLAGALIFVATRK